ncbi:RICIN domain-containing protein [Streptomyces sp. NPDC059618]|uniref:RICIN domain-containing protein n=1 Tax=Streptomyces sp. NPDC059618 TaxID=3346887 RepID=UPI00367DE15A
MSRYTVALACAAALAVLTAGSAVALPADTAPSGRAPAAATAPSNTYVLAPQDTPDQWLGDADYYGSVVCKASRLWYGDARDNAVWQTTTNGDGTISLVNLDIHGNRERLQNVGEGILVSDATGDASHWYKIAGPSGTFTLQNKATRRYLAVNAAGTVLGALSAYWWYMVNTLP